jgi:hypothetical protein
LTSEEIQEIRAVSEVADVAGERYLAPMMFYNHPLDFIFHIVCFAYGTFVAAI